MEVETTPCFPQLLLLVEVMAERLLLQITEVVVVPVVVVMPTEQEEAEEPETLLQPLQVKAAMAEMRQ